MVPEDIKEFAWERLRLAEKLVGDITSELQIDCHKGCAFCCYGVPLWVKLPELVVISEELNQLSIKDRKSIASNLRRYEREYTQEAQRIGYTLPSPIPERELDAERLGVICGLGMNETPCPFLNPQDKACLLYEVRPLMCRLTLFKDSKVCEKDWKNPIAFVWKNKIMPFIEGIKTEFHKRWSAELKKLSEKFPRTEPAHLEELMYFLPQHLHFDLVKKKFKLKL